MSNVSKSSPTRPAALPEYPHLSPELLKALDDLLNDSDGPGRLADDMLELFERAIIEAEVDLHQQDAAHMYFPWRLMKVLRKAQQGAEQLDT